MCKLLLGIKVNSRMDKNDNLLLRELLNAQLSDFESQKDGAAALVIDPENNFTIEKSVDDYHSVFKHIFSNFNTAQVFGLHTRIATSGAVDNSNTHFFEKDGRIFAHNGIVGGYSDYGYNYAATRGGYWDRKKDEVIEAEDIETTTSMLDMLYPTEYDGTNRDMKVEIARSTVERQISRLQKVIQDCPKCNPNDIEAACADHVDDFLEFQAWSALLRDNSVGRVSVISNKQAKRRLKGKQLNADDTTMTVWTRSEAEESGLAELAPIKKDEEGKPCDSKQFFLNLPAELTQESIAAFAKEKHLNGVATLIDTITHKIWLINTRKVTLHTDFKSWLVVYSYNPTSRLTVWRQFMNLLIEAKDTIEIDDHELNEGVHEIPYLNLQ